MNSITSLFKKYIEWFSKILEKLSSRPPVGGIFISGLGVQFISFETGSPQTFFFKFPPGVIRDGKIENKEEFANSLRQVRDAAKPKKKNQALQVVVTLPTEVVFTQGFEVPNVGGEKLEEAANLNLQMISPIPQDLAYMSWQTVCETNDRYELFGAFAEKETIESFRKVFEEELFHPVVFEFPALSLSRVITNTIDLKKKAVLVLRVSGDGIEFSIIRNNNLQFTYFRSWSSIQWEGKQISRELFEQVLIDEVQKVVNFTLSRFKETLDKIIILAPGFDADVQRVLKGRFGNLGIIPFTLPIKEITPSWYVTYGSVLRGRGDFNKDEEINLNYGMSADLFLEQYVLGFTKLWRNIWGIVFAFFFVLFVASSFFLSGQMHNLNSELDVSKLKINTADFLDLRGKAIEFNSFVDAIKKEPRYHAFYASFIEYFLELSNENKIIIDRMELSSPDSPVRIAARAPTSEVVVVFKNILLKDERFSSVDLPLFNIRELSDNTVSFSITFSLNQSFFTR